MMTDPRVDQLVAWRNDEVTPFIGSASQSIDGLTQQLVDWTRDFSGAIASLQSLLPDIATRLDDHETRIAALEHPTPPPSPAPAPWPRPCPPPCRDWCGRGRGCYAW